MPRGEYLGEFEQMVMLAVARLGDGAYGMAILDEIHERTGAEAAVASVYAAKRYFAIEPAGAFALARSRNAIEALWEGLELPTDGAV
jgi:hypothetical protein